MKRLLLINPNTTQAMTDKVANAARAALPGVDIHAVTGRFGPRYIASRASYAIAAHAALDAFAEHRQGVDAVLLACFGDPGLEALREVSLVPVIGLVDACCAEAGRNGRRFSLLTGGAKWQPMLAEMLLLRGLASQVASIRTVAPNGGEIAQNPAGAAALLAQACRDCHEQDGAECIVLGGAGLIGLASMIQADVPVPVLCSMQVGFAAAGAALQVDAPPVLQPNNDPVQSIGLSIALSALLGHDALISTL